MPPTDLSQRRGALRVLLIGEEKQGRADVRAALGSIADMELEVDESEAPPNVNGADAAADVAMVMLDHSEASLGYLRSRSRDASHPALFALLPERSTALMRQALRAGADELLFLPLDPGDAARAMLKITEGQRRAERDAGAIVCSLTSAIGGIGVTVLAANLALALHHALGKRVALLDLDLQESGLGVFLNLEPQRTLADLTRTDRTLDSIQLEASLTRHPSGIYLLAAPRRIEDGELISESVVGETLGVMRQLFDFVVIDCGRNINPVTVAAWERSDWLLCLLNQSVGSVRCAWRFVDVFSRLGISGVEPSFVLNRYAANHAISDEQVEEVIGRPLFARVPDDARNLERVQWGARDLWQIAPRSALVRSIEDIARRLLPGADGFNNRKSNVITRLVETFWRMRRSRQ